jgi:hypothetical protein
MEIKSFRFTPDPAGEYTINRMTDTIHKVYSLLDRGRIINYVTTDIDNVNRLTTGSSFNIGAIEFHSRRPFSDFEVTSITSPGAYIGKFGEEQIMLSKNADKPYIIIRAIVRNNGQVHLANVPVVCSITIPPATTIVNSDQQFITLAVGEEREMAFFATPDSRFSPTPFANFNAAYPTM